MIRMTNLELCNYLDINPQTMSYKCNTTSGSHFMWNTREILLRYWDMLPQQEKDYLIEILKTMTATDTEVNGEVGKRSVSDYPKMDLLFTRGNLIYTHNHLNRLQKEFQNISPFTKDRLKVYRQFEDK